MKILFIEDDEDKFKNVSSSLLKKFPDIDITTAKSLNGGLRALARSGPFDALLLDMSMPNYDVSTREPSGGTPESYAGKEIMMQMRLRGISVPTVVITMFESYGDNSKKRSAKELDEEMQASFAPMYRGMVYYNSTQSEWSITLNQYLIGIANGT